MYLGDMGADVIKIEPIRGDDARTWGPPFINGEAAWFVSVNRNKRSLCLDIRTAKGREVLFNLLDRADVLVENLNPGKLSAHGLALAELGERFPHLVICALSGFGLDGPDSGLSSYDLIAQARSGLMSVTGEDGVPTRVGTALSDIATGMVAAFSVTAALVRQQRTGLGELVDISLLEVDLALMAPRIASFLAGSPEPQPCGGRDSVLAVYQRFSTLDNPIVVAVGNDRHWIKACTALGLKSLVADPGLLTNAGRRDRRQEVVDAFQDVFRYLSSDDALKILSEAGIPCSTIQSLSEVVSNPQVVARNAIYVQQHPTAGPARLVSSPWVLRSSQGVRNDHTPSPGLGEHSRQILAELGLTEVTVDELTRDGVVWAP